MTNASAARRFFVARVCAIANAFWWGLWLMYWTDSALPPILRQIWCVICGVGIAIALEIVILVRKLEIATAIDSMDRAHSSLVAAMQTMADIARKLESRHPNRNVNPECWRN